MEAPGSGTPSTRSDAFVRRFQAYLSSPWDRVLEAMQLCGSAPCSKLIVSLRSPQTRFVEPRQLYEGQYPIGVPRDLIDIRPAVNAASGEIKVIVARSECENPPGHFFFDDHAHLDGIERRDNVTISVCDTHRHAVARDLADAGRLDSLIMDEVSKALKRRPAWSKLISSHSSWWRSAAAGRRGW